MESTLKTNPEIMLLPAYLPVWLESTSSSTGSHLMVSFAALPVFRKVGNVEASMLPAAEASPAWLQASARSAPVTPQYERLRFMARSGHQNMTARSRP
ncbi:hypothetical protein D1Y85_00575 [Paraburkholderia dinghuensis]|uniref:Uncharacterized protein n=1 Tax=Paraburkholderia dinghuensis TaxID=2305225 RepID=A0A3N6QAR0_9BURK|nr:hypothetical protein D1Y85_00575 [Paraburkholderia dinghuensis]